MVLIIAGIVLSICLVLLGLTGDFLVNWLWFSTIGYLGVFWTTIAAEAEVFSAVFVATAIILWVNGSIASRFGRSPWMYRPVDFEWKRTGSATLPEVLEFVRHRSPWPFVTASAASLLAVLVAWGEVHNWGVFLRFLTCPMAQMTRSTTRTSGSISLRCPRMSSSRIGCCSRSC
jgi:uncharacterized membrane protein (UPF0182 family)